MDAEAEMMVRDLLYDAELAMWLALPVAVVAFLIA